MGRWARAAAAITAWKKLKVAIFGYAMNDMGDIRVDESALVRSLGPEILAVAPGDLFRGMQAVTDAQADEVIAFEDERFEIDPRLSAEERADHARMQVAIEQILDSRGFGAYTAHFDAIGEDGRFARLPLAAASSLMAKGYGYGAEGDVLTACMVSAGHTLIGDAHFTEMYAMDFPSDSVLMSHMGEGNWKIARRDRPVKLIKRPLGIGRLETRPRSCSSTSQARRRWPRWCRSRESGSGWSWPRARTWTARNCPRWRCPTASSARLPGCAAA